MSTSNKILRRAYFDHIPKTGGTACYEYFRECMGEEEVSPFVLFELAPDALAKHSGRALLSGHFEPLPGCLPADRFSFTVLRDPIDRILSEYSAILFDEREEPGESFKAIRKIKRTALLELLLDDDPSVEIIFRNRQARHFAGYSAVLSSSTSDEEILELAKAALSGFDLVGVFDDFEGFLELACEGLGIEIPDKLPSRNVTSRRLTFDSLGARERELLLKLNQVDEDLVNFAKCSYRASRRKAMRRLIGLTSNQVDAGVTRSESDCTQPSRKQAPVRYADFGTLEIEIVEVSVRGDISGCADLFSGESTTIGVVLRGKVDETNLTVGMRIVDSSGALIYGTNTYHQGLKLQALGQATYFVAFTFRMSLGLGSYRLAVTIHTGTAHTERCYHWKENAATFAVVGNIQEHFEGVVNLPMTVTAEALEPEGALTLSRRETDGLYCRSLVVHSPSVTEPAAIIAAAQETIEAQPEEVFSVKITATNAGSEVWPHAGTRPVCCAYHIYDEDGNCISYDGIRTRLREAMGPGKSETLEVAIIAPKDLGSYQVEIDIVQESVCWFLSSGPKRFALTVARRNSGCSDDRLVA